MAPPRKECGTEAAWRRHYLNGETPCEPCRDAYAQALIDRGKRPARWCTTCNARLKSANHDRCYKCRTGQTPTKPRAKPKAADITWAKDHAGVFRAVEVIDPEPDGPRRFHTDAGVVC